MIIFLNLIPENEAVLNSMLVVVYVKIYLWFLFAVMLLNHIIHNPRIGIHLTLHSQRVWAHVVNSKIIHVR